MYRWASGEDQAIWCWRQCRDGFAEGEKAPSCLSRACSVILSKGRAVLPRQRLLRRFHRFHMTRKNSSRSLLPAKTKPITSVKFLLPLSASWFYIGVWFHKELSTGQPYRAWTVSSWCILQISHKPSEVILRRARFTLVGKEFEHARQIRFLTLFGTAKLHILLQRGFMASALEGPSCWSVFASNKNLYPDLGFWTNLHLFGQFLRSVISTTFL